MQVGTEWIVAGLETIENFQIREAINIDFVLQSNQDSNSSVTMLKIIVFYLLIRSLTALTSDLNTISATTVICRSSQRITFVGGYLGLFPPPTNAIKLV